MNTNLEVKFEDVREIIQTAFPGLTTRRTVRVEVTDGIYQVSDYWSEGSRNFAVFLNLETMQIIPATALPAEARQQANNHFNLAIGRVQMIPGIVVVENTYFQGKNRGFRIYLHPANLPKMLPSGNLAPTPTSSEKKFLKSLGKV